MTDAQKKFLEISKRYEQIVEDLKNIKPDLQAAMTEIGVGTMFQDPETLLVYKIEVPKGKYQYFDPIDYVRTKKDTETKGDLSKKAAEEAGFVLSK